MALTNNCPTCGLAESTIDAVGRCGLKRNLVVGEPCVHIRLTSLIVWDRSDYIPGDLQMALGKIPEGQQASKMIVELAGALVELDRAAGEVLEASLSNSAELHKLDEVRGRIWASYNAASRTLKQAARERETSLDD